MRVSSQTGKKRLPVSVLLFVLLVVAGCSHDQSPRDLAFETFTNFLKGLIDVGIAIIRSF